jgi:hypothetical protein
MKAYLYINEWGDDDEDGIHDAQFNKLSPIDLDFLPPIGLRFEFTTDCEDGSSQFWAALVTEVSVSLNRGATLRIDMELCDYEPATAEG